MGGEVKITLGGPGAGEYEEKRSRFIGYASPAASVSEANDFIAQIRKKHSDARHNVYAFRIGENATGYSDDGEPKGTGGLPVLGLLQKAGITDAVIVVTRYFGGVLLGTGGLVRAYTEAAQAAVKAAGIVALAPFDVFCVTVPYRDHPAVLRIVSQEDAGARQLGTDFGENVTLKIAVPEAVSTRFQAAVADATGGRAETVSCGREMLPENK